MPVRPPSEQQPAEPEDDAALVLARDLDRGEEEEEDDDDDCDDEGCVCELEED